MYFALILALEYEMVTRVRRVMLGVDLACRQKLGRPRGMQEFAAGNWRGVGRSWGGGEIKDCPLRTL